MAAEHAANASPPAREHPSAVAPVASAASSSPPLRVAAGAIADPEQQMVARQRDAEEGENDDEDDGENGTGADVKSHAESFPARFSSWEALEAFMKEFKDATYQMFLLGSSTIAAQHNAVLKKRKWHSAERDRELIPADWKCQYYRRVFMCVHGPERRRSRSKGVRSRIAVRDTGCTARLTALVKFDATARRHYIHVKLFGWHNHPCTREQYFAYAENRKITEPAVLSKVQRLMDQGLLASAIHKRILKVVITMKGKECIPTRKDVQNIIDRLRAERKQAENERRGEDAATESHDGDNGTTTEVDTHRDGDGDEEESAGEEDVDSGNRSRKRKTDEGVALFDSEDLHDPELVAAQSEKRAQGMKLFQLQALLDSPYSYGQVHGHLHQVAIARVEQLPQTISGFRHDIIQVSRSETVAAQEIDFVLPKYVLYGCETGINNHCRFHGLAPSLVGVRLPVRMQEQMSSREETTQVVTLGSQQLQVMKQFHYQARENVQEAKRAIEWVRSAAFPQTCPSAPLDDYFYHSKESMIYSLKRMPLTKTLVGGKAVNKDAVIRFMDSIHGVNVLKFGSSANVDADCVKAVILGLHARFHMTASFVCPDFNFEMGIKARGEKARAYGAFECQRDYVIGVVQLVSMRWGSFFLVLPKQKCYVYAPSQAEFSELRALLKGLLREYVPDAVFEFSPSPSVATGTTVDSGVLALLFMEVVLNNKMWADIPMDAMEYFRVRYLMQTMLVVKKQNVHDIQWV